MQWNESLVDKMKAGDQDALEQCYRQLSPLIYTAIFNICRDQGNANDLLQDTFIAAFEKIHSYTSGPQLFPAWIKRIAFNHTFNFLKKHKLTVIGIENENQITSTDFSIEILHEQHNFLSALLLKISEKERLIIWLYVVEQYSHEEIGNIVKKSPSYSKSVVSRCLKKLRAKQEIKNYAY
ncbi:MAG: RNA polymerase sigma factor (sigma-70 family) [Colwellia sp.]|uniref:RNA polymerase sigma factor n=1 Tax=Colwellia sp. Bg11-12 TaxID=2759817 RepID=UPI0015F6483E|nr:sigma-70 family RNA polymerase sigma factor [Colwellia sp. Bg11-12]MBA6265203.1 sigma-70 family RNA polymerase sigma factor [Colwellia sp. Bg11-12]